MKFDAFASATGMDGNHCCLIMRCDGNSDTVKGSATYTGAVPPASSPLQSTTDDSALDGGHFTAAATLTANFDADLRAAG